jgi:hypothetical protein
MKYLFLLALLAGIGCSTPKNEILVDKNCGNLHCVVFTQNGDTFALDFLSDQEFDSLKKALEL